MEYKQVSYMESYGTKPVGAIGIKILLSIDRELSEDEGSLIHRKVREIRDLLAKNNILNDETEQFNRQLEKEELIACFPFPIYVKEIPNEYYTDAPNPWFLVTTSKGVIKIGRRKRVINIDWEQSDITALGRELFKGEEYTTGAYDYESVRYIHASSYEKAKEYIQKLLNN